MTKYNDNGSRASESTKKFLNDSGLSHVFSLITSFVRNYASPKTHNHDGVYAKSSHTHTTSQVTGLDSALAGKASTSHTHTIAQVTNLQSSLDSKTPNSRKVNGKPLSTDITLTSADVKADAAGSATNALNSAKQYTDTVAAGKAAKSHIHDAANITTGTMSQDRLPLVPVTKGGTGKTNGKDAANYLINSLEEGTSIPTDADKILTQYVGGGTTNTTYLRRPLSTLWSYIKPKCDAIYQAKGSYAAASHTHAISNITNLQAQLDGKQAKGSYAAASHTHTIANIANLQSTLDSKQPKGDYASAGHSHNSIKDAGDGRNITFNYSANGATDASWYAVWNGSELKSMSKADMKNSLGIKSMSLLSSYPVGAVYISYSSTSPASLFGGSWVALKGVFPYFNAGTSTGGSNSHTLSVNELASHGHGVPFYSTNNEASGYAITVCNGGFKNRVAVTSAYIKYKDSYTGNNYAHNNMPSYQTLYAWRRTA